MAETKDVGTLLQKMGARDQLISHLTPEQNSRNAQEAGPALLKRLKEGALGMLKGNTTDIVNIIQQVSDIIPIGGPSNQGKPLGDEIFTKVTGQPVTGSNAETAGSMISVGSLIKKAAAVAGTGATALGTMSLLTKGVKAEDTVAKGASASQRGMIVAANKAGRPQLYAKAVQMVKENPKISNKELFDKTGTYFDQDGVLKAFVSDKDAKLLRVPAGHGEVTSIENILEHPRLFEAQPELQALRIKGNNLIPSNSGSFNINRSTGDKTIETAAFSKDIMDAHAELSSGKKIKEDVRSTILHETQHAIQAENGWTRGANPRMFQEFDPASIQEKINRARASGDVSQVEAANRFAKKANEFVKSDRQRAHAIYENVPGEQEARFTQFTSEMSDVEGNTFLKRVIDAGQTPQNWDTQAVPAKK